MKADIRLKQMVEMIEGFPSISLEKVEQGKHYKLFLDTPCGKQILVLSRSTSDNRATLNNRSLLRRWANKENHHG